VVNDLAAYTPGPECLAARKRLLEGIMATWPKRAPPVAKRPQPQPQFRDTFRAAVAAVIDRAAGCVKHERDVERAMIATRQPMPNNYWLRRRRAEQRLAAAMAMLEATLE
jgi:hypothetical protein